MYPYVAEFKTGHPIDENKALNRKLKMLSPMFSEHFRVFSRDIGITLDIP